MNFNAGPSRAPTTSPRCSNTLASSKVSENLAYAHWEKLVWNIPFNGLWCCWRGGLRGLCTTINTLSNSFALSYQNQLSTVVNGEALVRDLMHEVIATANALGHALEPTLADKMIERTRTMGAYKASTILDFERGQPLGWKASF